MEQRSCSGVEAVDTTQLQSEREWSELNYIICQGKEVYIQGNLYSIYFKKSKMEVVRECSGKVQHCRVGG